MLRCVSAGAYNNLKSKGPSSGIFEQIILDVMRNVTHGKNALGYHTLGLQVARME